MASGGVKALQCEVNGITTVPKLQTEQLHSLESILGKSEGMRSGLSKEPREGPRTKEGSMRTSGFFTTWYYLPLKNRDHVLYSIPPPPPQKKSVTDPCPRTTHIRDGWIWELFNHHLHPWATGLCNQKGKESQRVKGIPEPFQVENSLWAHELSSSRAEICMAFLTWSWGPVWLGWSRYSIF